MNIKKWIITLISFAALILGTVPVTQAHTGSSEAYSDIVVETSGVKYGLQIDLLELLQAVVPGESGASNLTTLNAMNLYLKEHQEQVKSYVFSQMKLYADGIPLEGTMTELRAVDLNDRPFAEADLYIHLNRLLSFWL